jgi:hypothetical protein
MKRSTRTINLLAALVVPFVVQTLFLFVSDALGPGSPLYDNYATHLISTTLGFLFVVRALRQYAIFALIYFPMMFVALMLLSLAYGSGTSWSDFLRSLLDQSR